MDFLDMKEEFNKEDYVWFRGITGVWQHWEKRVLNGEVVLIIEGSERQGYWGRIQSCADDYDRFDPMFSTMPKEGLHVPFRTPENCAVHLEHEWKEIVKEEGNKL